MKAKQIKEAFRKKENDIVKNVQIYCAEHNVEFTREHNKILRTAMRKMFCEGVYPLIRDLFEVNIKDYHND